MEQTPEAAALGLFFITWFVWNSLCHKQNKPPRKETPLKIISSPMPRVFLILSWLLFAGVWGSERWKSPGKRRACLSQVYISLSVQLGCTVLVALLLFCFVSDHVCNPQLSVRGTEKTRCCRVGDYRIHYLAFGRSFKQKGQVLGITECFSSPFQQ